MSLDLLFESSIEVVVLSAGCLSGVASIEEYLEVAVLVLALYITAPEDIHEAVSIAAVFSAYLRRLHAVGEPLGQLHILDLDFLCEAVWLGVVLDSGCFMESAL